MTGSSAAGADAAERFCNARLPNQVREQLARHADGMDGRMRTLAYCCRGPRQRSAALDHEALVLRCMREGPRLGDYRFRFPAPVRIALLKHIQQS